jgi:branched-subunit amino acid aminotransferase/4-amino-4-deoxychorismate lyase
MYLRPYMFSHDGALGVHKSSGTTLAVIMSPVGPYFKSGACLWCAVLCCVVLCCVVLCCAVLCCAVLCCAVL